MKNIFSNRLVRNASLGVLAVGSIALTMFGESANAGTATGTLPVSANITSSCTVTGTPIDFGANINPVAVSVVDAAGSVSVTCSNTTQYTIGLNAGTNGADAASRHIKNGTTNLVPYQLYSDSARQVVWSTSGASVGSAVSGTGTGALVTLPVFGRLSNFATAAPGTYSDSITVTVTY